MFRNFNTSRSGNSFDLYTRRVVFEKAATFGFMDPNEWRIDSCGSLINWSAYGDINSKYGWEIDHIYPVAHGGSDSLLNLQALQWRTNRIKGDSLSGDYCLLAAA